MNLKQVFEQLSSLAIEEERSVSEDYLEIVFLNKEFSNWDKALSGILGPAVKPAGQAPTSEDDALTSEFGGIFDNQTLFKKDMDGKCVIAMFWPWQDKEHTTLKMALLKK